MNLKKNVAVVAVLGVMLPAGAQDPIIQTRYTADPAPMVYNDTIFLYTTHDEDDADGFKMLDWLLYTSTDMVNWTDHGPVASLQDFSWRSRDNGAWAEHVIERNGKFYMYCPLHGHGIGVLVSDTPYGPFKDPLGKPLVWNKENWYDIDPAVYIDDDGQAYMYWGNPKTFCVRLNEDMISTKGDIMEMDHINDYQEGPWLWARKNAYGEKNYYLAFASTCCPEGIGYAMSKSPTGPWEHKGHIMDHTPRTRGNHPGIIEYKGKSYVFGLNYDLLRLITDEHHERRSVSAAEMKYNPDGTIIEVPYWKDTVLEQIEPFDPYRKVQAETMAWGYGLKTDKLGERNMYVHDIDNGEYIMLRGVDFGKKGAKTFSVDASCVKPGGMIELRLDKADGPVIGRVMIKPTGSIDNYSRFTCKVKGAKGVHDLYLCFSGNGDDLFNLDSWNFKK
ncbi:glycoside hydrolase family 43 protein [Heminiphilus faecis]|uniref:glycoside hydrolase family 43 protein n=1 Tax=Heminiphilus faecis TaxID=2601703 RepID=UPI001247310A|nr:glycoside hydrolase family 43 protein [Heminiphilus faecis]